MVEGNAQEKEWMIWKQFDQEDYRVVEPGKKAKRGGIVFSMYWNSYLNSSL